MQAGLLQIETQQNSYSSERCFLSPRARTFLTRVVQESGAQGKSGSGKALLLHSSGGAACAIGVMALDHFHAALPCANGDRASLG